MYTTYYPNLQPYILEGRINGKREDIVYIYDVTGQKINEFDYVNGQIDSFDYRHNDLLHNLHGPAVIQWLYNGQIYMIVYWQDGLKHNLHGPAYVKCYNGQINIEYWQNGNKIKSNAF